MEGLVEETVEETEKEPRNQTRQSSLRREWGSPSYLGGLPRPHTPLCTRQHLSELLPDTPLTRDQRRGAPPQHLQTFLPCSLFLCSTYHLTCCAYYLRILFGSIGGGFFCFIDHCTPNLKLCLAHSLCSTNTCRSDGMKNAKK